MHKLAGKSEVIEAIFDICHPNTEDRSDYKYEVPFLKNFKGESPMDILNRMSDYRSMDMMLEYLSGYGIDHHSRAMSGVFAELIKH